MTLQTNSKLIDRVKCYQCGYVFLPNPESLKEWAESGRRFDPTDWVCDHCRNQIADEPKSGNGYWCCSADFGEHDKDCKNYRASDSA